MTALYVSYPRGLGGVSGGSGRRHRDLTLRSTDLCADPKAALRAAWHSTRRPADSSGRGADFAFGGRPASWASVFARSPPWVRPVYAPANDVRCRCAPPAPSPRGVAPRPAIPAREGGPSAASRRRGKRSPTGWPSGCSASASERVERSRDATGHVGGRGGAHAGRPEQGRGRLHAFWPVRPVAAHERLGKAT